jgi:hypothetical protein
LLGDGGVVTWGDPNQGGDSSRPARNVGFGDGKPDFFGGKPWENLGLNKRFIV